MLMASCLGTPFSRLMQRPRSLRNHRNQGQGGNHESEPALRLRNRSCTPMAVTRTPGSREVVVAGKEDVELTRARVSRIMMDWPLLTWTLGQLVWTAAVEPQGAEIGSQRPCLPWLIRFGVCSTSLGRSMNG